MTTHDRSSPPPRPTPLLLTGRIDEIDPAGRSLRVGSHAVEIPATVSLDGIRVGERVIVKGVREPTTGRMLGLELVPLRGLYSRPPAAESWAATAGVRLLVVALLAELGQDAQALECELLPEIDRDAIRLALSGAPERAVLIPRQVLERALDDPNARRTVHNVLQAAVTLLRTHRAVSALRRELAQQRGQPRSWFVPRCVRCEGALSDDDPIVVEAGFRRHLACPPMW